MTAFNLTSFQAKSRVFTRLLGLDIDPQVFKYSSGEADAYDALDHVGILLNDTRRFVGRTKHMGKPFDFVEDIKADMVELMLQDPDVVKAAVNRKRHTALFYLVVEPALEALRQFDHATAVNSGDELIAELKSVMFKEADYGTHDDAIVAQHQVKHIVSTHDEQMRQDAVARKKKSKTIAKEIE